MTLVAERIEQHCKQLRLIHLATEWPAIAESCVKAQRSLADFLDQLLTAVVRRVNSVSGRPC